MEIIVCGPPHSGKSVFIATLEKMLPADGYETIRVHKDGEGDWSNNPDQNEVKSVRIKASDINNKFIKDKCRIIRSSKKKIVIVDIGGMLYDDKIPIFKNCSSFIVLSSDRPHRKEWQRFGEKHGAVCIANLASALDEENPEDTIDNCEDDIIISGIVKNLNRGMYKLDSPLIKKVADRIILESGYKNLIASDNVINFYEIADEIGCNSVRTLNGIKISYNVNFRTESVGKILSCINKYTGRKSCILDGARANWISALASSYLLKNGVEKVKIYDTEEHSFLRIKKIKMRPEWTENSYYEFHDDQKLAVIKFSLNNKSIPYSTLGKLVLPEISSDKKIIISGRIPHWLLDSVVYSYKNNECYVFQPGSEKKFICVSSKDESKLGSTVEKFDVFDVVNFVEEKKFLYLDMDRVLVDFASNAERYHVLNRKNKILWPLVFLYGEKFWDSMNWFPGAEQAFKVLKDFCVDNEIRIKVLSSVKLKSGKNGKLNWCRKNLGIDDRDVIIVGKAADKSFYSNANSILVDDNEDNAKDFEKSGGHGFKFRKWDDKTIESIKTLLLDQD